MLKTSYKHDKLVLNTDVDLDLAGPVVHNSLTVGHLGWLLGLQTSFDTSKSQLTRNNFAVGYAANDFTLHTNVNDGTEVGGSIYQRVNDKTELGVSLSWSSVNNQTRFALASKYQLDKYASVQAKVNNLSQIGLSYSQQLRDGIYKLVLSCLHFIDSIILVSSSNFCFNFCFIDVNLFQYCCRLFLSVALLVDFDL